MPKNESVTQVIPDIDLFSSPIFRLVHCRIGNTKTQQYCRRSTAKLTTQEARDWVLENAADLFQITPTQRGGGTNSISRHSVAHIEYHRKRLAAGEIPEKAFISYKKHGRHFTQWFKKNRFNRLADIQQDSPTNYALDRQIQHGVSTNTVNGKATLIRM